MINNRANLLINNYHGEDKNFYIALTQFEKEELILSMQYFGPNFEEFVSSFKQNILEKSIQQSLKNYSEESLFNLLASSLNLIVSSCERPIKLDEFVTILAKNYPNLANLMSNVDLFIKCFMMALIDTFKENYTERLGDLWYNSVSKFYKKVSFRFNN